MHERINVHSKTFAELALLWLKNLWPVKGGLQLGCAALLSEIM